ncbi:hypothetical protein SDJN02_12799, partial [Cucurbita argyrosperma subsp. argyrosperma]
MGGHLTITSSREPTWVVKKRKTASRNQIRAFSRKNKKNGGRSIATNRDATVTSWYCIEGERRKEAEVLNLADPQKKKLSCKTTLHKAETDTDKGSIKKEKSEIVGKKKLEVPQTASRKTAGSVEKGFEFRSKASKIRKDTDADTPESENRRHRAFSGKTTWTEITVDPQWLKPAGGQGLIAVDGTGYGCDSCQKWRLLPFGKKPKLPEKWLCSMLNWLPGMNRCDISEEETTEKLLMLLYQALPFAPTGW